jgi:hypothetical protein
MGCTIRKKHLLRLLFTRKAASRAVMDVETFARRKRFNMWVTTGKEVKTVAALVGMKMESAVDE